MEGVVSAVVVELPRWLLFNLYKFMRLRYYFGQIGNGRSFFKRAFLRSSGSRVLNLPLPFK